MACGIIKVLVASNFMCAQYLIVFPNTVQAPSQFFGNDQQICEICLGSRSGHSSKLWKPPVVDPHSYQNAYHLGGKWQSPWDPDQGCKVHAEQSPIPKGTAQGRSQLVCTVEHYPGTAGSHLLPYQVASFGSHAKGLS